MCIAITDKTFLIEYTAVVMVLVGAMMFVLWRAIHADQENRRPPNAP